MSEKRLAIFITYLDGSTDRVQFTPLSAYKMTTTDVMGLCIETTDTDYVITHDDGVSRYPLCSVKNIRTALYDDD